MREFVFNETMQVGIVVRDLDAAIRCDRNIRYGSICAIAAHLHRLPLLDALRTAK